jgi:ABC-type nitrate/sulfonate/bicarbonate transport system substrate-binding protein
VIISVVLALVIAACGGDDDDSASGDEASEGNRSFSIGHVSSGSIYDQIPVITNQRLNDDGWNVQDVYFARTELTPQALAQNNIQVGLELYLEPLRTIQAGGDDSTINYVMENNGAEFVVIAKSQYPTCEDMDGIRFGIHGEESTASIAAVNWLHDECGVEPEILVIPGGENRIVALENDELDATLVQYGDWVALESTADPGEYTLVDSGDAMAFTGSGYYVNTVWLDENHDVAVAYFGELLRTFQMVHDDPTILEDSVRENVDVPEESIAEAVRVYLDPELVGLAPIDPLGGEPLEALQAAIDFFTPEELDEGLDPSTFFDQALLDDAIEYLNDNPSSN